MQNFYKKKLQGIISHLDTSRTITPTGKHVMKICPELVNSGIGWILLNKTVKIIDVPPVTFDGAFT